MKANSQGMICEWTSTWETSLGELGCHDLKAPLHSLLARKPQDKSLFGPKCPSPVLRGKALESPDSGKKGQRHSRPGIGPQKHSAQGWEMFVFNCGIFIQMTSIHPKRVRMIKCRRQGHHVPFRALCWLCVRSKRVCHM